MPDPIEPTLHRTVSLPLVAFYGLGTMLGAGIYALVGEVAAQAGMLAPLSFVVACALALPTALSYAELSTRYPLSAGEAIYAQNAFSSRHLSVAVGLLVVLTGVLSSATLARAFVGYLHEFVKLPDPIAVAALVAALGLLAAWGIRQSLIVAMVITLIEIAGLLLVAWAARGSLAELPGRAGELVPGPGAEPWIGMGLGGFIAFYAFIGFEDMVNIVEEVKRPTRTLPRAIHWAFGLATGLYVLVALAAVLALPLDELARDEAPLARLVDRATGTSTPIALIGLLAIVNGALVQLVMGSRILYGMSRAGWLPRRVGSVHRVTRTPLVSTAIVTATVLVLSLSFGLVRLAEATAFIMLMVFSVVNLALWRVKRRDPAPPDARVYPSWVPIAGFLASVLFLVLKVLSVSGVLPN